ncbi:MAG TPA: hypothetical protein VMV22_07060 [Acidimicrobiales bacterium]|nr:hypothetical protein [Acidimicrobiales bacterium]
MCRLAASGVSLAVLTVGVVVGAVSGVSGASASTVGSKTQAVVCPGSGLVLTLRSSSRSRAHSSGPGGPGWVSGQVLVTAADHRSTRFVTRYRRQGAPAGGEGTVVTGQSVQISPGGGPFWVNGTAYLAPDGLLGRTTGSTTSICAALGG